MDGRLKDPESSSDSLEAWNLGVYESVCSTGWQQWMGGRFMLVVNLLCGVIPWTTSSLSSPSSIYHMADQGAPQTAKQSKLKGFRNRLKKVFGLGTPPTSRSNSYPADLGWSSTHCRINQPVRSCENPSQVHPLPYPRYREGECW